MERFLLCIWSGIISRNLERGIIWGGGGKGDTDLLLNKMKKFSFLRGGDEVMSRLKILKS